DSRLFLRAPDGTITEITGNFRHAMNGSFGRFPHDIAFMAMDDDSDAWNLWLYNAITRKSVNLTEHSGFQCEDPKFSPDGRKLVFKRSRNGFFQLAELDLHTKEITLLTEGGSENSMPCYSADGQWVYFSEMKQKIRRIHLQSRIIETVYSEPDTEAYYPICSGEKLYFTKWISPENHRDCIMQYDKAGIRFLGFDSPETDCSDVCPVDETHIIYSCTRNGSYDLFCFDGKDSVPLTELNTDNDELGAVFYHQKGVY
ncbi:MAG: hypothetical protein E7496_12205, partial [Ruminococcus sp.]|nr:hypothetical protein [Ruminococcus sp.]